MTQPVEHPFIPNWTGERSWSAPEDPPSEFLVFEAGNAGEPYLITHGRDMMFDRGALVQDYNFIDYLFGDPTKPIHARYYLRDDHVSVDLPDVPAEASLKQARAAFPEDVLRYLQRRFDAVHVLTCDGYRELWAISA